MSNSEKTSSRVSKSAAKVLANRNVSKGVKSVAASALTQKISGQRISQRVASKAAKVLRDPKASRDAKAVAASALTQFPAKKPPIAGDIRRAVEAAYKMK